MMADGREEQLQLLVGRLGAEGRRGAAALDDQHDRLRGVAHALDLVDRPVLALAEGRAVGRAPAQGALRVGVPVAVGALQAKCLKMFIVYCQCYHEMRIKFCSKRRVVSAPSETIVYQT